jgi:hypothetical protein
MATELGGSVFEITRGLIGDLFRDKNAGVTAIVINQLTQKTPLGTHLHPYRYNFHLY